jgi:nucleotide-binding universal stress UspA family protein
VTAVHHLSIIAAHDRYGAELARRIAPDHVLVITDREDLVGGLVALSKQLPTAPRVIDLVGMTGADKLLTFHGRSLDTRIGRVRANYRELADQGVLARLDVVGVRVIGCMSAVGEPARRTIAQLAEIMDLEVTGTTELVTIDDFSTTGFVSPPPRSWNSGTSLDLDNLTSGPLLDGARALTLAQAREVLATIRRDAGVDLPGLLAVPQAVLGVPRGDHFHHLELLLDHELVRAGATVFPVDDPRALRSILER